MNVSGEEQKVVKCCTGPNAKSDFEFLAGQMRLCDSKHALHCQTYEKKPQIS